MRSLVLARDDNAGRHCIWWVYTFFRQKNIRTKVMTLNCTDVCSSELYNTLSHSMLSICDAGSVYPTFVERTEEEYSFSHFLFF